MYPSFKRERQILRVKFSGHFMWTERVERAFFPRFFFCACVEEKMLEKRFPSERKPLFFPLAESRQDTCGGSENQGNNEKYAENGGHHARKGGV